MSRFKDFDAYEAERTDDPIEFQMGGRRWKAVHVNHHNFLALVRGEMSGSSFVAYDDFIHAVLDEKDRAAFDEMLAGSNVSLQTFAKLSRWIVEQATGAPLADADDSPPSRSKRGGRPRVVSLSKPASEQPQASAAG